MPLNRLVVAVVANCYGVDLELRPTCLNLSIFYYLLLLLRVLLCPSVGTAVPLALAMPGCQTNCSSGSSATMQRSPTLLQICIDAVAQALPLVPAPTRQSLQLLLALCPLGRAVADRC